MKKLLVLFLTLISAFTFVGCSDGDGSSGDETPVYDNAYSYNETHHWKPLISGEGEDKIEYAEHENDRGKCYYCDYYYDPTEQLDFKKIKLGDVTGYQIVGYKDEDYFDNALYVHYKTPTHYQGEDDDEPLPVISIGWGAFAFGEINGVYYNPNECIKSIKLHEGLLEIKDWAFKNSEINELVIPNSVTNEYHYSWLSTINGRIYNICGGCYKLKRFVVGNGIKVLGSENFGNTVEEVILGSSVEHIQEKAFYEIYNLKTLVIPASVTYIPEESRKVMSGSYAGKYIPYVTMLPPTAQTDIFMEITKAEHDAMLVPLRDRDATTGAVLNPISTGLVNGWSGNCKVYFKGEWEYDSYGKPIATVTK